MSISLYYEHEHWYIKTGILPMGTATLLFRSWTFTSSTLFSGKKNIKHSQIVTQKDLLILSIYNVLFIVVVSIDSEKSCILLHNRFCTIWLQKYIGFINLMDSDAKPIELILSLVFSLFPPQRFDFEQISTLLQKQQSDIRETKYSK